MSTQNKKPDPGCIHCSGTGQYVDIQNDTTIDCVCTRDLGNPIMDDTGDSMEFKQHLQKEASSQDARRREISKQLEDKKPQISAAFEDDIPKVAGIAMRINTSEGKAIYNSQNREREAILAARDHCQFARDTLLEHCPDDGEIMMADTCLSQALYWFDKAREKW
jgi:hypothetical protein